MRPVDDAVRHFFAAVRGQAVQEQRVGARRLHQVFVDLVILEGLKAFIVVEVAHRHPGIGEHDVGILHRFKRILRNHDFGA